MRSYLYARHKWRLFFLRLLKTVASPCSPLRSEESFQQYFSEMPWLAVPYSDEARRSRLNRLYGIQGEPAQPHERCLTSRRVGRASVDALFLSVHSLGHWLNGGQLPVMGRQTETWICPTAFFFFLLRKPLCLLG